MQAVRPSGKVTATLVNYGIHAEELGFSGDDQDRLHLSSDWHNFARRALEQRFGGMAMTMAGSVGSVEMPQVYATLRDHTPTGVYSSTGNGGCRTIYRNDTTAAPYGYHSSTQQRGEAVARWAASALATGQWSRSSTIAYRRTTFFVPLQNALFAFGGALGVIPGKDGYLDGQLLTRNAAESRHRSRSQTSSAPTSSGTASATPTSSPRRVSCSRTRTHATSADPPTRRSPTADRRRRGS